MVYLKNGSVIRGIITEQIPNKYIKIETVGDNIFVFQVDEIEKLTKEESRALHNVSKNSQYKLVVELGHQVGIGSYGEDRFMFNASYGYQINPLLSSGIGSGLRYYYDAEAAIIPFYADFRVDFGGEKVSPYLSFDVGYSFDTSNDFKGVGFLFNPSAGVNLKFSGQSVMHLGIGYETQRLKFYDVGPYHHFKRNENCGAISILIGMTF